MTGLMGQAGDMNDTVDTDLDPRPQLADAMTVATDVMSSVRPEQLGDPTPCTGMAVRELMAHLVGVLHRVAAIGTGANPMEVDTDSLAIADDALLTAWGDAVRAVDDAWRDDASLDRPTWLPWQQGPAAEVLAASYLSEILVHTWDLATATAQRPAFPDDAVALALEKVKTILPADRAAAYEAARQAMGDQLRNFDDPFGPVVDVPDDAPLIDRLVGWTGRDPNR